MMLVGGGIFLLFLLEMEISGGGEMRVGSGVLVLVAAVVAA